MSEPAPRSKPFAISFETESSHGKKGVLRAQVIRFETIDIPDTGAGGTGSEITFDLLHKVADPRAKHLWEHIAANP